MIYLSIREVIVMGKPLEGIRVLDLARVLAGPFCAAQLADLGAEVIKIERPGRGDDSRHFGPYKNGESGYYILMNRGKKGITLNFREPRAKEIFYELAKNADVIVENFKPGVTKKMGIDYETIKGINPKIIYASISGFGQYGPAASLPGYDIVAQAMGGLMSITGYPECPPSRVGSSIGDVSSGLYGAAAILAALYKRERTGEGDHIDVSLLDSIFAFCETNIVRCTIGGIVPQRVGSRHPLSAPFDIYQAKDGYVVIAVANEPLMDKLCAVMEMPELHKDPRFLTDGDRSDHDKELKAIIEQWLKDYTVAEAVEKLRAGGVPSSPVHDIPQACADPQLKERHMLVTVDQPDAGPVEIIGQPMKFASFPDDAIGRAPLLGEDNAKVLTTLGGVKEEELQSLAEQGVI